jgi:hypothetical protein
MAGDYNAMGMFRRVSLPTNGVFWESNKDTTGCTLVIYPVILPELTSA